MNRSVSGITDRNKRSIRDIKRSREKNNSKQDGGGNGGPRKHQNGHPHTEPPGQRGANNATRYGLWFVGIVGILFLFFLFSVVFAETVVTVNPKTADISIDQSFTASNDPATDGVSFSAVSSQSDIELTATSSGSEYREETASGQVTIYNEYNSESIRLVPNTRFQIDGNIYRTSAAVTVPGQTAGGEAGTVTAQVTAEAVGSAYNTAAGSRFSIPGFADTVYAEDVYAISEAGIRGGVAGDVPVLASSTQAELEDEAAAQLRAQLLDDLSEDLPEGFFLYDDATFFSSQLTDSEDVSTSTSRLTITGTLEAVAFDSGSFSAYVGNAYSGDIAADANVEIEDLTDYEFAFADKANFTPGEDETFSFELSGESQIVFQYDQRALVRDLRGLQKSQLNEVLENYPGVQSAQIETRPFWKQTLPGDAADIDIETVIK